MRCIRPINKHHFHFFLILSKFKFWHFGVLFDGICQDIYENERIHYKTLNIHTTHNNNNKCVREFKFGIMIHHYRFNSCVYSMTSYDLDRYFQGP